MKYKIIVYFIMPITFLLIVLGCNNKDEETIQDTQAADLHLYAENAALDIYKQVQEIVKDTALSLLPETGKSIIEFQKGCAKIEFYSHDTLQYDSIRIEYGDGCTGVNDYTRKGTLVALLNGKYTDENTDIIVRLYSYEFNGYSVKADAFLISCLGNIDGVYTDSLFVDDLKTNGISWCGSYTLSWISGAGTGYPIVGDDLFEINGNSDGSYSYINSNEEIIDVDFSNDIVIPLRYSLGCKCVIQGLSEFKASNLNSNATIDYGNNGCNNIAVCIIDGEEYELTID